MSKPEGVKMFMDFIREHCEKCEDGQYNIRLDVHVFNAIEKNLNAHALKLVELEKRVEELEKREYEVNEQIGDNIYRVTPVTIKK